MLSKRDARGRRGTANGKCTQKFWIVARCFVLSMESVVGIVLACSIFLTLKLLSGSNSGSVKSARRHQPYQPEAVNNNNSSPVATIAYAVSVTGCGSDPITEGAAVLQHSIHRTSIRGRLHGHYDYALYAIVHPDAIECAMPLQDIGYTILQRNTLVSVSDIQGEFLRSKIQSNGCCGEKELIKLEAYTLIDYPIVVHLDLDVILLKPMDVLFDLMLGHPVTSKEQKEIIMWGNKALPRTIDAFFTIDYNMVSPNTKYKPVQGGFLVLRPSMKVYEEYKDIIRKGDFQEGKGWGGKVGPFHGSMTFQGLIPYFYNVLHSGSSVELNRCIFNQMCDNPRTGKTVDNVVTGACRTGEKTCQDCRTVPIESVVTTHFTLCQKPWWCLPHSQDVIQHRLCRQLTQEWYKIRSEMEKSWGRSGQGSGNFDGEVFGGYCTQQGKQGYLPIEKPFGAALKI